MILKVHCMWHRLYRTLRAGVDLLGVRRATGGLKPDKDRSVAASEALYVDVLTGGCGCTCEFMFVGVRRRARIWEGQSGISHCH